MADIIGFKPKKEKTPTEFTHDFEGKLLPPKSYSRAAKLDKSSMPDNHLAGKAQCMLCEHVADVVTPVGASPLDCPSCKHRYMLLRFPPFPKKLWVCNCGCDQFYLTPTLPQCVACGHQTKDWANS